jgi:hypothetical protein
MLFDAWPLTHLFWLVPLLFALHNAEAAPRMADWARAADAQFMPAVSTMQFTVSVGTPDVARRRPHGACRARRATPPSGTGGTAWGW